MTGRAQCPDGATMDARRSDAVSNQRTSPQMHGTGGGHSESSASSSTAIASTSTENGGEQAPQRKSTLATELHHSQGRQRKGSLRKAAMAKMRERSSSSRQEQGVPRASMISATRNPLLPDDNTSVALFSDDNTLRNPPASRACVPEVGEPQSHPSAIIDSVSQQTHQMPFLLASPSISSPEGPYVSTTDEEESTSLDDQSLSSTSAFRLDPQNAIHSFSRRRAHRVVSAATLSVFAATAEADNDEGDEEEWDYSETEWWGWVILIATWTVFVVVMGSCLGVWSWAWDVGETPYAPPDLEDDDTLPITGYYPALMVCTAVMSWVWVVVAWVGIKYFRHAKVGADDG